MKCVVNSQVQFSNELINHLGYHNLLFILSQPLALTTLCESMLSKKLKFIK